MYVYTDYKTPKIIVPSCTVTNWSGLTNQPAGDGVEIVSDNTADTMVCTIFGTTHGTNAFTHEQINLNGTTVVSTTKPDWGNIYGVILAKPDGSQIKRATGTITIREASGNQAITTITATNFHAGMMNLYLPGTNVEIFSESGNLYWKTFLPVATATTGITDKGKTAIGVKVKDYVSLISDNTGSVCQIVVLDD